MIGIGIIGCGKIAQVRHIPEYAANPRAKLLGFYDLNPERARELAAQYGGTAYGTLEELLANPEIEAVSVCSANTAHAAQTIQALKAGKHVLCEKPMAATLPECEAMVAAAKASGKLLMIGLNQRLAKAHQKGRELIEAGAIGRVVSFATVFGHGGPETWSVDAGKDVWFFDKARSAMGVMGDLGIHKTDLMQYLLGKPFVRATARLLTLDKKDSAGRPISVEDNAFCIYETRDGTTGTMTASWSHYGREDNSTRIYGTEGILKLYDNPAHAVELIHKDGSVDCYDVDEIQTNDKQTSSGIIDLWMDCLEGNKGSQIISGEEVLSAMRVVFAAFRSAAENRTIEIPENCQ